MSKEPSSNGSSSARPTSRPPASGIGGLTAWVIDVDSLDVKVGGEKLHDQPGTAADVQGGRPAVQDRLTQHLAP